LVLLGGALLAARSLNNVAHQDFAIATQNRYVLHLNPSGAGYSPERLPALYRQIEGRFSALPGVAAIGLALYSPLEGDNWGECVILQGHPAPGPNARCGSSFDRVSNGFLDAIGVPILRGRGFGGQDTASSQPVALVNKAFVKRFFPNGQDPLGQHFGIDQPQYSGAFAIVGVFRDFKLNNPRDPVRPVFLRPTQQIYSGYQEAGMKAVETGSRFMDALVVDFRQPPAQPETVLRRTLAGVDANLTVSGLRSFQAQVDDNFNQDRLVARLTGLFGVLALLLASVGLYGVTAYLVARRTSEIGLRMALGATRARVVGMVLRGVMLQFAAGLALGIPAALVAGHFMASQLFQVSGTSLQAWSAAAVALAVCALIAGFIPARRAASIDPVRTLRAE
ncbi:MAG: FtsX-like permease family protein, partial [Terriglobales bacterium]